MFTAIEVTDEIFLLVVRIFSPVPSYLNVFKIFSTFRCIYKAFNYNCSYLSAFSEHRLDFVLLHTDEDQDKADVYMDHIREVCRGDLDICPQVSVQSFNFVQPGKRITTCLASLHTNFNNILLFVTENFEKDEYSSFLADAVIIDGLLSREDKGKKDRVIPVWNIPKVSSRNIFFKTIHAFNYMNCMGRDDRPRNYYVDSVRKTVKEGRRPK